jgi:hypothetical protein
VHELAVGSPRRALLVVDHCGRRRGRRKGGGCQGRERNG